MYLKSIITCLSFFFLAFTLTAANITVSGYVKDGESKQPLEGVVVTLESTAATTVTDSKGAFVFYDVTEGEQSFSFSMDGYITLTLKKKVGDTNSPSIQLGDILMFPTAEQRETGILNKEDFIPTISLNDEDLAADNESQNISGILSASRDVFVGTAAFTFGPARFRIRGYDSENTFVYINGVPFNELENGRVFWSAWGGLNDVFRSRESEIGLNPTAYAFGGVGGSTAIDTRASSQRKQIRLTQSFSNRSYRLRTMATYSTGMMENGWAISASGSHRWADEGYAPGSFYDSWSYFLSVDRKLGDKHLLNLNIFGSPTKRGRNGAGVIEMNELAGTNYYNPFWGYQDGKKRNSRVSDIDQPVAILRHDWNISPSAVLTTAVSYQAGKNAGSAIDWFDAPDPRPDYYRYLPSNYRINGEIQAAEQRAFDLMNDENERQIRWDDLYEANALSTLDEKFGFLLEGQEVEGQWSQYILENRHFDTEEFNFYSNYQQAISDRFSISGGLSYRTQTQHAYKMVKDLLGGDYTVDVDRFILRDSISSNPNVAQSNLDTPNRVIREGDTFGYNYEIDIREASLWGQAEWSLRKFDLFFAANVSNTRFWRTGKYRTGSFPDSSQGESERQSFTNFGVKGGATYKIDGRNYLYANGIYQTRAPFTRNAYVSPRTRDQLAPNLDSETITSVEGGYLLRSPIFKARATAYYTQFSGRNQNYRFFGDNLGFGTFVWSDVDQLNFGTELAVEAKITSSFSINAVAALGNYRYNDEAKINQYEDVRNEESVVLGGDGDLLYLDGLQVTNGPQNAYTLGLQFRPKGYWFAYLNFNYFDRVFITPYPLNRWEELVIGLDPDSQEYENITSPIQPDGQFTMDFFGGKSFKFGNTFLYLNLGVSNILDNQELVTGGFEQFRFDTDVREGEQTNFPPRFFYLFGRNYFVNISYRF
jgi:hypothetical protein